MTTLAYTPISEIDAIHAQLDATFRSGKLQSIPFRKYLLLQIGYMLKDNTQKIVDALHQDLGKPDLETHALEIGPVYNEISDTYSHLEEWSKPTKPPFSLLFQPLRRVVYKQGKGVCLVIGPFNYPISMCIGPIISAVAAGNTVVFKPSEATPAMSALFAEMFPKYIDPSVVRVVNGGIAETSKLLEFTWGHILFTGSGRVGRVVATAAGKTLSPVTLELGGKSPVFIDPSCDLETTARRLLWGKVTNSGQTCIAPDYVLVPRHFQETFLQALKKTHDSFYPQGPFAPNAMGKMINEQAFKRVSGLLEKTRGTVVFGGQMDEATKAIAPTIVKDVSFDDPLMSEEIFGPLLPVIPIDSLEEGIAFVNKGQYPLTLYVFSTDSAFKSKILKSTVSGSIVMNDTLWQAGCDGIPFGGIGPSGTGFHNGKYGFDTFTHFRASLDSPSWVDLLLKLRYPPYTATKIKQSGLVFWGLPGKRPTGPPSATDGGWSYKKWIMILVALVLAGAARKRSLLLK
ncbi:NAD-aldehyde dehydrogenase [Mucidula mucida]|nr:NAD-aldehyde dehydrogenase [Mucidula mucida]